MFTIVLRYEECPVCHAPPMRVAARRDNGKTVSVADSDGFCRTPKGRKTRIHGQRPYDVIPRRKL